MLPAKDKFKQLGDNVRINRVSYLMMLPYLIFFVLFTILPVIVSIVLSFTDYDMVQAPVFVGLENYFQIFLNDEYIDDAKVLCVRVYKAMDGGDFGIFAVNTEAEFTNMTLRIPGA